MWLRSLSFSGFLRITYLIKGFNGHKLTLLKIFISKFITLLEALVAQSHNVLLQTSRL